MKAVLAAVGVVALALLAGGVAVLGGAPGDVPDMGGYVIGSPGDPVIEVYPAGVAPASGKIIAPAAALLSNGAAFSINDHSSPTRTAVRFYIRKTPGYVDPIGGVAIDVSSAGTASQVANAIDNAVDAVGSQLFLYASAPQTTATDGTVFLSYDYGEDPLSTGNDVTIVSGEGSAFPGALAWTPGGPQNDIQHVQWAIDHVAPGGTILLKRLGLDAAPTPFNFGTIGRVTVDNDVTIRGEYVSKAGFSDVGSGGWVLAGTTILGGTQMQVGKLRAVTYAVKDIIFDGAYVGALAVGGATTGYNEISGCSFRNPVQGRTVTGNIKVACHIVAHGGETLAEIEALTGTLKVANNFFGRAASPANNFNNLMHFSNCSLDLEISGNEIEDAAWGGFVVFGNRGHTTITRNTITKTQSYRDGGAISIGVLTPNWLTPYAYNGSSEITNNRITVAALDSAAIIIANYPDGQFGTTPDDVTHVVSGNRITMAGTQRPALSCLGACSNTIWSNNTVIGSAAYGISLSKTFPSFMTPIDRDAHQSRNRFVNNDFSQFVATRAQVQLEQYSRDNTIGPANVFGSLRLGGVYTPPLAAYVDDGTRNTCESNDFSPSTLQGPDGALIGPLAGWPAPPYIGAILLRETSSGALINERARLGTKYFPPGTSMCSQILSMNFSNAILGVELCSAR